MKNIIKDKLVLSTIGIIILFIVIGSVLAVWDKPVSYIGNFASSHPFYAPFVYMALDIISIIIAPVTTIPLIPLFVGLLGEIPMVIYSVISWTIGGVIVFLIGRKFGRPVISKFVSIEEVDKYRKFIPEHYEFVMIILLRIIIPVDLLSYALGFFSKISLWKYTLATIIGVIPGAILMIYAGGALITGDIFMASLFVIIGLGVFVGAGIIWKKLKDKIID